MAIWHIPELLGLVCEFSTTSGLAALCRTSKGTHSVAQRVLYRLIHLSMDYKHPRILRMLCSTLKTHPELASHVRVLSLELNGTARDVLYNPLYSDAQVAEHEAQSRLLLRILRACINLRAASIDHPFPVPDALVHDINRTLFQKKNLRELEFAVSDTQLFGHTPGEDDINVFLLIEALRSTTLQSLLLLLQQGLDSPLRALVFPANSSITKLGLHSVYVSMEVLDSILGALSSLRDLSLWFYWNADLVNEQVGQHLDCRKLRQALEHRSSTLESLSISVMFTTHDEGETPTHLGSPDADHGVVHTIGSLRSFTELLSLEIAPEVLLGGWKKEVPAVLSEVLPVSLRRMYFEWDFQHWKHSTWQQDPQRLFKEAVKFLDTSPLSLQIFGAEIDQSIPGMESLWESIRPKCHELGITLDIGLVDIEATS